MRTIMIAVAMLTGVTACSGADQQGEQVQADNIAVGSDATNGGDVRNGSSASTTMRNTPTAEGQTPTSGMPVPDHPEVNEHFVYNDEAAADR